MVGTNKYLLNETLEFCSNNRNVLKIYFVKMLFSACRSCIIIKSFSFPTTPDPEIIISSFYGITDLKLSIITHFLELKYRFYQPMLDCDHLICEL